MDHKDNLENTHEDLDKIIADIETIAKTRRKSIENRQQLIVEKRSKEEKERKEEQTNLHKITERVMEYSFQDHMRDKARKEKEDIRDAKFKALSNDQKLKKFQLLYCKFKQEQAEELLISKIGETKTAKERQSLELEYLKLICPKIKKDGYIIQKSVLNVNYLTTLGLTESYGFPELIITDLYPFGILKQIIKWFIEKCLQRKEFHNKSEFVYILNGIDTPIGLKPVLRKERLGYGMIATDIYDKDGFKMVQLIFPDEYRRLPWDKGYTIQPNQNLMYSHCWNCYKEQSVINKCSGCEHVRYCDANCQKANWKVHKTVCSQWKIYRQKLVLNSQLE